jgi:carboxyl-terminal processing protease
MRSLYGQLRFFALTAVSVASILGFAREGYALNCQQVRQLVGVYFKMHFDHHDFDDEMSRRTVDNFLRAWDPGKVYFLKGDVKQIEEKYATKLDDMIMDANCQAIDEITKLYAKRFNERQKTISDAIDAKHDFSIEEFMTIDRKKLDYATTTEEIADRWRQRVKFQLLQLKQTLQDLGKAREKLHKRYQLAAKRQLELTSDDMYSLFLNAFSLSLDPHSEYMSAEQLEDFRISTRLSLEGIGAVLRSEDGFTTIQSLVPGGAAFNTGKVKVEDKIIAVAQGAEPPVDVIDMDLREVVKLIRGTRGTEVRLTLVREDSGKTIQLVVPIIREQIQLKDRAAKSSVVPVAMQEGPNGGTRQLKIGVIDLPSFYMDFEGRQNREKGYKSSSADMRQEINSLKKQNVDGIVIDLRSNGGGSLDESIDIAGLFFDKGPVVQIKDTRGSTYVQKDENPETLYTGPLVVLTNKQSASASEIFAGAIQDYQRGLIVGDAHTFGKGTVQNLNDIDDKLGAVKVTISKFYRPSGSSTQLKGVESDIVLPDLLDEYELGEKHYDYALPWDKISSSDFKSAGLVNPDMTKALQIASKARVSVDKSFEKVFAAIKEYKQSEESRSRVSLKEEPAGKDAKKDAKVAEKESSSIKGKGSKGSKDKKKKDQDSEADEEGEKLALADDFQLQETLRVAADYIQLLSKKPLAKVNLPTVDTVAVAKEPAAKEANPVKKTP